MISNKYFTKMLATALLFTFIASCSDNEVKVAETPSTASQPIILEVHKSPTCGCCKKWIDHLDINGFQSKVYDTDDISVIKNEKGIAPRYRSCHTAVSQQGYVFEGHVPAKFIHQFLHEDHAANVIGLSVPAMPLGSPGMEVEDKFHPYKILLLKADGSYEVYASIQSSEEQY